MRRKVMVSVCLLVVTLMLVSMVPVGAKRPPKDPPPDDGGSDPAGTIYYILYDNVDGYEYWKMDADGGNKAEFADSWPGSLSLTEHDGNYWFVYFKELTTTHPDGKYQTELRAVRDDGTDDCLLWYDSSMVYMSWNGDICWMTDDAHISWATWRIDQSGTISDPGIYMASMSWGDNDDTPSLGTPVKVYDVGTYQYDTGDVRSGGTSPNWSADGSMVLYNKVGIGCMLVDLSDPDNPTESSVGYSGKAAISPDGTKLAIAASSTYLIVMGIDGTNEETIDYARSTKYLFRNLMFIHWSPDSTHITYGIPHMKSLDLWCDVYVIGADGTGKTSLTKTTTTCDWHVPLEWR